ncbi:winged helix-turn-helix domain-containing protein [Dactylosporangium sp. NPDC005572]|uniref:winged helix-turn-helix domain-containing protein n=1 Tax=Dactylosporangium sp. NPDC005572 TaxID=3156889 RepID=UPI0033A222A4
MSSPAMAVPHHPLSRTDRARPDGAPVSVLEVVIVIHADPHHLDTVRKLTEQLPSSISSVTSMPPELVLRPQQRTAYLAGQPLALTRREYDLLLFLARNRRRVFTRGQLLLQVWEDDTRTSGRTVDAHVRRLRLKLAGRGPTITTVHGIGYRLDGADRLHIEETSAPTREPMAGSQRPAQVPLGESVLRSLGPGIPGRHRSRRSPRSRDCGPG